MDTFVTIRLGMRRPLTTLHALLYRQDMIRSTRKTLSASLILRA